MAHSKSAELVWRSDPIGKRNRMHSRLYLIPAVAGSIALCALGITKWLAQDQAVAWAAFGGVFAVVAAYMATGDLILRRSGATVVRLTPELIELSYADGTATSHPLGDLLRLTIVRDDIFKRYVSLELRLRGRLIRTQAGSSDPPPSMADTLRAAGIEVRPVQTSP